MPAKEKKETTKKTPPKKDVKKEDKKAVKEVKSKAPTKKATPKKTVSVAKKDTKEKAKTTTKKTKKVESGKKFYQAVGRRKTSTCTVRLYEIKGGGVKINDKNLEDYFPTFDLQKKATSPLARFSFLEKYFVSVKVRGGGRKSQADAIRHGIGRAVIEIDSSLRKEAKTAGYLTRDPRMRESKKPGLKRARRAPQWRKR